MRRTRMKLLAFLTANEEGTSVKNSNPCDRASPRKCWRRGCGQYRESLAKQTVPLRPRRGDDFHSLQTLELPHTTVWFPGRGNTVKKAQSRARSSSSTSCASGELSRHFPRLFVSLNYQTSGKSARARRVPHRAASIGTPANSLQDTLQQQLKLILLSRKQAAWKGIS